MIAQTLAKALPPIAVSLCGSIGAMLAPSPDLVTLPGLMFMDSTCTATLPAAMPIKRCGRKPIYILGSLVAVCGALGAFIALSGGARWNIWTTLVFLGVGWTFADTGTPVMITRASATAASLFAGVLFALSSGAVRNITVLIPLALVLGLMTCPRALGFGSIIAGTALLIGLGGAFGARGPVIWRRSPYLDLNTAPIEGRDHHDPNRHHQPPAPSGRASQGRAHRPDPASGRDPDPAARQGPDAAAHALFVT
ncbi:hypothetical protein [Pararhodobacter zhoushanensis]|uniref:Uncharacterized protein n=1 Tax=Pararhodobacter zhoushanensis TaxID=2479545 RepID=A0ABT3GZJ0_9RHOB|nr:hypothetical protein [Pararhodobacter zhoushanensis]MCW1932895.1 hypothetical protein [Pararhodobacter zhoushanensis]